MKADIHPKYTDTKFTCTSCGFSFTTRSTMEDEVALDVCSNCHPYYTGKHKLMDTAGRVERFRRKYGMQTKS